MSSLEITDIEPDPEEILLDDKNELSAFFSLKINHIKNYYNIKELQDVISEKIYSLEGLAQNLLDSYTLEDVTSPDHYDTLNKCKMQFNQKAEQIAFEINNHLIEIILDKESHIEDLFEQLIDGYVLSGFKDEIDKNKSFYSSIINQPPSPKKLKDLVDFEKKITSLLGDHSFAKNINLNEITERTFIARKTIQEVNRSNKNHSRFISEIKKYYKRLNELDSESASKLYHYVNEADSCSQQQRLQLIRDNVMLTYGKVKEQTVWTMIYRNLLDEMSSQLPEYTGSENLLQKIDELKSKKYIDQSSFRTVQLEYINFVQQRATAIVERKRKERIVKELSHSLINMGYNVNNSLQTDESFVRQILAGDKIYFDTKWDGYKIMVMLNPNGEIVTRLVKFVRDGKERTSRSSYTKQRDLQICHVWCSSYDQLVSHLKSCGFIVKENLRKSPDDEELVYIVDEKETKVKKSIKTEDRSLKLH